MYAVRSRTCSSKAIFHRSNKYDQMTSHLYTCLSIVSLSFSLWNKWGREREIAYNRIDVLSVIPHDKRKKHIVKNTFFCMSEIECFSPVCVHKMALQYHWHSFKSINMAIEGGATKHKKTPALNSKNQFEPFFSILCTNTHTANSVNLSNGKHVAYRMRKATQ